MSFSPTPSILVSDLIGHYDRVVLPLWTGPGWNPAMNLPYEAVGGAGPLPLPVTRYRAMACARQLYVFARSGNAAHADVLFGALQHWFADPAGGWYYSVDAQGAPLDRSKDLYTHAFVVFACAAYLRLTGNPAARAVLDDTVAVIETRFARRDGLPLAAMTADFRIPADGGALLQNPLMHLTEAYLAAHALDGDARHAGRLAGLADGVFRVFVDPDNGCVAELPVGARDNRVEPGHQFEWFALVRMSPALFAGSALEGTLSAAYAFARRHGVDNATQGVVAAVDALGATRDAAQRIWAQTEYGRALALRDTAEAREDLRAWLAHFPARFLHARGWHECIATDGGVLRGEMPSTTPYHLATSYEALQAALVR